MVRSSRGHYGSVLVVGVRLLLVGRANVSYATAPIMTLRPCDLDLNDPDLHFNDHFLSIFSPWFLFVDVAVSLWLR